MNSFIKSISLLTEFLKYNLSVLLATRNTSSLKKNKDLKGKYNGKVFILFTGNSAGKIDLSFLKNEYTIGVNRFFLHPQYKDLNVDFFSCIADWRYIKLWTMSWIVEMCFLKSKKSLITFLHSSASVYINDDEKDYEYRDKKNFFDKDNIYYVQSDGSFSSDADIKEELDAPCNILNGSLYFSVGLAMYLGFKEIYLLGADNAKEPLTVGHFYDGLDEVWDKEKVNACSNPNLYDEMINKQKSINLFALKNNVKLFNVIEKGFTSPVFQSVDKEELMNSLKNTATK